MSIGALYPTTKPSLLLDFAKTKELDPRITFTRASTATYYDNDTSAKAEENLFTWSQDFSNGAWSKPTAIITANATTAPDSSNSGQKVSGNTAVSVRHPVYSPIFSLIGTYTISVYVKAAEYDLVQICDIGSGNFNANFNLTTVTATSILNCTPSITSVGNGWYRCIVTTTQAGNNYVGIQGYPLGATSLNSGNSYTGDGTSGVYVWGAQLEQRSSVTAYTATTTAAITNYIPVLLTAASGIPRFDHNPISRESLGLLIEEQRTNLIIRSEEFNNGNWLKSGITVTANQIVAPDGALTGDLISSTSSAGYVYPNTALFASAGGNTYTYSVYAKAGSTSTFTILIPATSTYLATFNLSTQVVSGVSANATASMVSVGNGWYRLILTCTNVANSAYTEIQNGRLANGTDVYIWGAQLEVGAFSTSYIPTVASQITRSADNASMTGTNFSQWYRADEGTLYQNFTAIGVSVADRVSVHISDGAPFTNGISFRNYNGPNAYAIYTNGVVQCGLTFDVNVVPGIVNKVAGVYKTNDAAASKNAGPIFTDTSVILPTVNQLVFPASGCNYINKFAYYPKRLTNTELQGLTS
jgi:hypothetical protein